MRVLGARYGANAQEPGSSWLRARTLIHEEACLSFGTLHRSLILPAFDICARERFLLSTRKPGDFT